MESGKYFQNVGAVQFTLDSNGAVSLFIAPLSAWLARFSFSLVPHIFSAAVRGLTRTGVAVAGLMQNLKQWWIDTSIAVRAATLRSILLTVRG
jgi:hypothetical protein